MSDHRFVYLGMPDAHGSLRGKTLSGREFKAASKRGYMPLGDLMLAVDPRDGAIMTLDDLATYRGCPDLLLRPEADTLRDLPGRPGWGVCIGTPLWENGDLCELGSRVTAQAVLDRLDGLGFGIKASLEYEFRVWDRETKEPATGGLSYHLVEAMRVAELTEAIEDGLATLGIELRVSHAEGGAGLLEVNVDPADGVNAADRALLLKSFVKSLGAERGLRVSFLAKPVAGEEGSSGHFHISLWTKDGANAFAAPGDSPESLPDELSHALAGIVRHLPAACLLYNPTINSFKRLVPGFFAPVNATWGLDNRLACVRAILRGDAASRLEIRRPGADANPYLVLAATTAAVVSGLESSAEPPPPFVGDPSEAPADVAAPLPTSLESAAGAFRADGAFRAILGERFSEYFARTREWELHAWQQAVTDWECSRYEGIV
jgi:glutamine synthetase